MHTFRALSKSWLVHLSLNFFLKSEQSDPGKKNSFFFGGNDAQGRRKDREREDTDCGEQAFTIIHGNRSDVRISCRCIWCSRDCYQSTYTASTWRSRTGRNHSEIAARTGGVASACMYTFICVEINTETVARRMLQKMQKMLCHRTDFFLSLQFFTSTTLSDYDRSYCSKSSELNYFRVKLLCVTSPKPMLSYTLKKLTRIFFTFCFKKITFFKKN